MNYRIELFDKQTQRLTSKIKVPDNLVDQAKAIAWVVEGDDGLGEYYLTEIQATKMAVLLGFTTDQTQEYFLSPYDGGLDD